MGDPARVRSIRIASAWLIRRFIDPRRAGSWHPKVIHRSPEKSASAPMKSSSPTRRPLHLRVLTLRLGRDDPALSAIAEIIHDIDLKDGKFGRPEAAGLALAFSGIAAWRGIRRGSLSPGRGRFSTASTATSAERLGQARGDLEGIAGRPDTATMRSSSALISACRLLS